MGLAVHNGGSARFLFAMFQGGGNIALILPIAARLIAHGHRVRILAGPGVRASRIAVSTRFLERIAATGATTVSFRNPTTHPMDEAPPSHGLIRGWTPKRLAPAAAKIHPFLWTPVWAENVADELHREPADVLVTDFVLLGALVAAEAAKVPAAALVHNIYPWPARGLPPYGAGLMPARDPRGALRDALTNAAARRLHRRDGLAALNRTRAQLGLQPLRSPLDQYDRAERVLVLTSAAFDFSARRLPANVRYVGTPFDDPGDTPWISPWPVDDPRPLVLVSLSTLPQGQAPVMHRILSALASMPVRALVTLGPALDPAEFHASPNVVLERFVPHAAVLPQVAVMITQGGLSSVMKALAYGVPLVCVPLIADQPDNAARIVARGAGVRLASDASPEQLRLAIQHVLAEPRFREGARFMAAALAGTDGAETAARELEALALVGPTASVTDD